MGRPPCVFRCEKADTGGGSGISCQERGWKDAGRAGILCRRGRAAPAAGAVRADGAAGGGAARRLGEAGRLKRAARRLARLGVCRVLVPEEFCRWELLCRWGLGPVDPVPFFRACAGGLALAALRREGSHPIRGTVALRGRRVDRDMVRAAEFLCSRVRDVAVSAPVGGGELAAWLRREFGAPIRPDSGEIPAAVRFDGTGALEGRRVLSLFGTEPELAGIRLRAAALEPEDREKLP